MDLFIYLGVVCVFFCLFKARHLWLRKLSNINLDRNRHVAQHRTVEIVLIAKTFNIFSDAYLDEALYLLAIYCSLETVLCDIFMNYMNSYKAPFFLVYCKVLHFFNGF